MTNITINTKKQTIEMDKTTAKSASQYGTDEYKALQEVRIAYPTYSVVVVNRKPEKGEFKGLTYEFMEKYIKAHDDENKSKMKEYLNLRGESEEAMAVGAKAKSYAEIKEWFLDAFKAFGEFYTNREKLLKNIADKKAKAKQDKEDEKRAQRLALVA
ncbi:MAG: hypothetical protein K5663_06525 [Clostridiales bacterium]|nr:hypothetical protein [Clostridiales bacterium]